MTQEALSVRLGGIPLEAFGPIRWRIAAGTEPVQEYIEVLAQTGQRLLAGGAAMEHTLQFDYEGGKQAIFSGIHVLSGGPGSRPDTMGILISDLRWKWNRRLIKRSYNIRRRSGATRRLGPEGVPIQVAPVSSDIDYQPWSLMPVNGAEAQLLGTEEALVPWTPKKALEAVLSELSSEDGFQFDWEIPDGAVQQSASFEMVELIDPANEAIRRLLGFMPGTDLYVDRTGKVKFFYKLTGLEFEEIVKGYPEYVSGSSPRLISFDAIRPNRVEVYFTPEIEVRFDTGNTVTSEGRFMRNVLPVPDPDIEIGGKRYIQGTWFPFSQELYNAWNTPTADAPAVPTGIPPISDTIINQFWFLDKLHQMYDRLGDFNPFQVWAMRIEAVKRHYRQTFQINRRWMDKMHSIRTYRVGILDPENGTRAPSLAYTDYCIRPNTKTLFLNPTLSAYGMNIMGYSNVLSAAKAAPATVELLDGDIGIIHIDYRADPFGLTAQIIPSAVDNIPSCDISNLNRPHFWAGARISGAGPNVPSLQSDHRLATVITAAPASPNNIQSMYRKTIFPGDIQNIPEVGAGPANGPTMQVWVGPLMTARFMWSDGYSSLIESAFNGGALPQQLEQILVNGDDVDAMAKQVAASVYARFTNRYQGGMSTALNQDIQPNGNLLEVTHSVGADGDAGTSLVLPAERAPYDALANLPASTRRIIFREVQP